MNKERYNYYEILELPPNAPQHEVTTAYERARATYSGENPAIYTIFSEPEARELLTIIEEAYSVLGNKSLRTIYDQRLFAGQTGPNELSYQSLLTASRSLFPEGKKDQGVPTYEVNEEFEKEIKTRVEWDGDFLRKVREYKNLSLSRMSEITKVNSYYLQAIESMEPGSLPAPVFVRGYVVQMAKLLGLNEKIVADSYMIHFRKLTSS